MTKNMLAERQVVLMRVHGDEKSEKSYHQCDNSGEGIVMADIKYLYHSSGFYLGFLKDGYVFSRDGKYLGWVENKLVWTRDGDFAGQLMDLAGINLILRNILTVPATSRPPKSVDALPVDKLPPPQLNKAPISLPIGFIDAFK